MNGFSVEKIVEPYNVSRESLTALMLYVDTLLHWQRHINLVGPSTVEQIWTRHILDSLQLLPLIGPRPRIIADLGAGAGIPGLILAIAGGHSVHLYESNGKKAAFLAEVVRKSQCPAQIHQVRIETLNVAVGLPRIDIVVSRAFAPLSKLLECAAPFMSHGAIALFHKGQHIDAELTQATKCWKIRLNRHASVTDSKAVILEIEEASRVTAQS
jgi:16S rRNA (guanine527-N7)-methyltransferase